MIEKGVLLEGRANVVAVQDGMAQMGDLFGRSRSIFEAVCNSITEL